MAERFRECLIITSVGEPSRLGSPIILFRSNNHTLQLFHRDYWLQSSKYYQQLFFRISIRALFLYCRLENPQYELLGTGHYGKGMLER